MTDLRRIPSTDKLLNHPDLSPLLTRFGRERVTEGIRFVLSALREEAVRGVDVPSERAIIDRVGSRLISEEKVTLVPVINATGVILHTNLGRAPLCKEALDVVQTIAAGYSTLEYDLQKGERGARSDHITDLLCRLTGAEDAFVVNNNAGAVLLCLSAFAARRKVVISRSQLVEIGGGFRIPDVMKQSGARLVEVGTTNRVHLADYEAAIQEGASLVLRAHSSNFKLVGFTTQPSLQEIADLAHRYGLPLLDDLGSGALLDTSAFGLAHEPMVQESIQAGADLVCFSGDKLLGGPQAGIIVGKRELIQKVKRHPLARALRIDKLTLAGLSATLLHYLRGEALKSIPVWRMIAAVPEDLKQRAETWCARIGRGEVIAEHSTVGGGSLPEETLPTYVLALEVPGVNDFAAQLRKASPAVICRVQNDRALFDPRTVLETEDDQLIDIIKQILARSTL